MKHATKMFSGALLMLMLPLSSYAATTTVSCDTNPVYAENSCNQCFDGGAVAVGDNKGELFDIWENNSDKDQLLFKEEQEMPKMMPLSGASWSENKAGEGIDFWQYTPELDALNDKENLGEKLPAGQSVKWIASSLGSAYELTSSNAMAGDNVGLLTYDIAVRSLAADGSIDTDAIKHRECVLFKAAGGSTPVIPETPELPETGPEHILLAFVALLLGFGFLKMRRK